MPNYKFYYPNLFISPKHIIEKEDNMKNISKLKEIAEVLRRDSVVSTTAAGSGHPSSCLSCAEIMSCLFFNEMSYDLKNPINPDNDEFILSKGHAAPILYSSLYRAGCINENLSLLRRLESPLEGHPMPSSLKWVKVATGSLGQGLSIGLGMALAAKLSGRKYRTYVLMGDSETTEGSVYEALQMAPRYNLNNLCVIVDINKLGQTGKTILSKEIKQYRKRCETFGWEVIVINGHSIDQNLQALKKAKSSKKPTIILAKTAKGKGVSFIEGKNGWHGRALTEKQLQRALKEIPDYGMPYMKIKSPRSVRRKISLRKYNSPKYNMKDFVATRDAYGNALAELAKCDFSVLAIDAEVGNSTRSDEVKRVKPNQFIETYIAEQNMVSMSLGLSEKGFKPFASTFAAFLTRAHDQIRMAALSSADLSICGSHSGVSIGQDGASQMGLEDIAMFRSLPGSIVVYPSDAVSTTKLIKTLYDIKGIKYLRTTRGKSPVIYSNSEEFPIGEFKILRKSQRDKAVLIGAGVTLHESLRAHEELKKEGTETAVIDLYCIKPINIEKLKKFIKSHGNKAIVAEDHRQEGGIGEMLSASLVNSGITFKLLNIKGIPHSGEPEQLLEINGIDSREIVKETKKLI